MLRLPGALVVILAGFVLLVRADPQPYVRSSAYENGSLGIYPELNFLSTHLRAPQLNLMTWGPQCATEDEYFFIAPRGLLVGPVGPVILDSNGHMIWHREDFGVAYNFDIQQYMGQDVLTFWSGDDMMTGHGSGQYYILDCAYRLLHKISALNNLSADLHELRITPFNTALITAYETIAFDLSYYNISADAHDNGTYIFDCIFQEIDIASGTLLFEWRASDHFRLQDCYNTPRGTAGTKANPFDFFHINSVDKDLAGDYIISARYSHAVTKISGATGKVIWHLGGKNNSFTDTMRLSLTGYEPIHNTSAAPNVSPALDFAYQHHARWHASPSTDSAMLTIFDNAAFYASSSRPPRGLLLSVSPTNLSVSLIAEYTHPRILLSESQGSMQLLDNGNVLIGYGSASAFTEFSPHGSVLCDAHFGALHFDHGRFSPGAVTSYRAFKRAWHGYPAEEPRVKFQNGRLYVSWNGATEVREWVLQSKSGYGPTGYELSAPEWAEVDRTAWAGFESNLTVPEGGAIVDGRQDPRWNEHAVYRLIALGKAGSADVSDSRAWLGWRALLSSLESQANSHAREGVESSTRRSKGQQAGDEGKMLLGMWEVQTDDTLRRVSEFMCPSCADFTQPVRAQSKAARPARETANRTSVRMGFIVVVAVMLTWMALLQRRELRNLAASIVVNV